MQTIEVDDVVEAEMSVVEAARQGRLDLLRQRPLAEVLDAVEDGGTVLVAACREGRVEVVSWLLTVAHVSVEQVRHADSNSFLLLLAFSRSRQWLV